MYLDVYDQFLFPQGIYNGILVRLFWFGVHHERGVVHWLVDRGIPYAQAWIRTPLVTAGVYRRAPQTNDRRLFTGILVHIPGYRSPNQRWPGWEWRWGWWLEVAR